jgi:hypothetical protein
VVYFTPVDLTGCLTRLSLTGCGQLGSPGIQQLPVASQHLPSGCGMQGGGGGGQLGLPGMQQFWPVAGSQQVGSVLGSHGGGGGGGQLGPPMVQQVVLVQHWPDASGTQQVPSGSGMQQLGSPGMHGGGGGGQLHGGQVTLPSGLTMHGSAGHTQGHMPVDGSQGGGGGGHSHGTGGHIWPGGQVGGCGHTQQRCGSLFGSHGGGGPPGVQQPLMHCTLAPGNDGQSPSLMHWPKVPSQHWPGIGGWRHSHWPFQ